VDARLPDTRRVANALPMKSFKGQRSPTVALGRRSHGCREMVGAEGTAEAPTTSRRIKRLRLRQRANCSRYRSSCRSEPVSHAESRAALDCSRTAWVHDRGAFAMKAILKMPRPLCSFDLESKGY